MQARGIIVVLFALLATGCTQANQDDGSGGGGGSACDGKDDCNACTQCASQVICAQLLSACNNDPDCQYLDTCVSGCGTDANCKAQCLSDNPNGASNYEAATRCLYCDECPADCAGYRVCD